MREKLNCPNCGAAITGAKCEYCGTIFYDFANIELYKAGYLRMKIGDALNIFKAVPTNISITNTACTAELYADDRLISIEAAPEYEVNICLRIVPDDRGVILERLNNENV